MKVEGYEVTVEQQTAFSWWLDRQQTFTFHDAQLNLGDNGVPSERIHRVADRLLQNARRDRKIAYLGGPGKLWKRL